RRSDRRCRCNPRRGQYLSTDLWRGPVTKLWPDNLAIHCRASLRRSCPRSRTSEFASRLRNKYRSVDGRELFGIGQSRNEPDLFVVLCTRTRVVANDGSSRSRSDLKLEESGVRARGKGDGSFDV